MLCSTYWIQNCRLLTNLFLTKPLRFKAPCYKLFLFLTQFVDNIKDSNKQLIEESWQPKNLQKKPVVNELIKDKNIIIKYIVYLSNNSFEPLTFQKPKDSAYCWIFIIDQQKNNNSFEPLYIQVVQRTKKT